MPALNRVQTERVITYFLLHNIEPIIKLFVLFFFFLFLFLLVINIVIISIIIIILCIVSGATMRNVFQSGFWCRKMAAGECGRSSRSVLGLVVEASNNPFVCVTIQSELQPTSYISFFSLSNISFLTDIDLGLYMLKILPTLLRAFIEILVIFVDREKLTFLSFLFFPPLIVVNYYHTSIITTCRYYLANI